MRKNPYDRILREKSKKQHLSTVPKGVFGRVDFREDERERERERMRKKNILEGIWLEGGEGKMKMFCL